MPFINTRLSVFTANMVKYQEMGVLKVRVEFKKKNS